MKGLCSLTQPLFPLPTGGSKVTQLRELRGPSLRCSLNSPPAWWATAATEPRSRHSPWEPLNVGAFSYRINVTECDLAEQRPGRGLGRGKAERMRIRTAGGF